MQLIRKAVHAGRFYPESREGCLRLIESWMDELAAPAAAHAAPVAAIAPHAGWIYSGSTAAMAIAGLAASRPETLVIFGAVHVLDRNPASLFARGTWETPLGALEVDGQLAGLISTCRDIRADEAAHAVEHSIEVELPLVRHFLGPVKIVPIMIQPGDGAAAVGSSVGKAAIDLGRRIAFLASTDLTHYGPMFDFEPAGRGQPGFQWAKDVNDRRFITRVANLDCEGVVPEAAEHRNACGSGAVAATLAAAVEFGAPRYAELRHTCSAECDAKAGIQDHNSVGYTAGLLLGP